MALAKVAEVEEELVASLAFEWLQLQVSGIDQIKLDPGVPKPWTNFECTNMRSVEEDSRKCMEDYFDAGSVLASVFESVGLYCSYNCFDITNCIIGSR